MAQVQRNITTGQTDIFVSITEGIENNGDTIMRRVLNEIIVDLTKEFAPEIKSLLREKLTDLVKEAGQELIVKGLKQLVEEDFKKDKK